MSWEIKKLSELVSEVSIRNRCENIPVYSVTNTLGFTPSDEYFKKQVFSKNLSNYKIVKKGNFAYNPSRINVGSIDFLSGIDEVLISPLYVVFACCATLDQSYLKYFLKSEQGISQINSATSGSVRDSLKFSALTRLEIPLPPLPIQKRIAEILDAADALKRKDQELLKKYDELAQSIFIDMFGTNTNVVKLNQITTKITDGVHAKPNYQDTGVPFLSVKNATNKFLDFENSKFITETDHNAYTRRCKPEFEDILYTKVGATYGRAAIIDSKKEFSIYVSLALIKPDRSKVYPYYLNFVLNSNYVKSQADRRVKGAGVPDLHLVEIKDFDIPLPSYKEQLDFSNVIENLNKNISNTKKQIIHSDNLFQTLIQKAFNGELVTE